MTRKSTLIALAAFFLLSACGTPKDGWSGIAPGGLTSSPSNHSSEPTLTAALLNSSPISPLVDQGDRIAAARAETRAYTAPIGQKITWNNPDNGNAGTITPVRDGYTADGNYCREFQQTVAIGSQQQQGYAKACQQADGSWDVIQ